MSQSPPFAQNNKCLRLGRRTFDGPRYLTIAMCRGREGGEGGREGGSEGGSEREQVEHALQISTESTLADLVEGFERRQVTCAKLEEHTFDSTCEESLPWISAYCQELYLFPPAQSYHVWCETLPRRNTGNQR